MRQPNPVTGLAQVPVQPKGVVQNTHGKLNVFFLNQNGDLDFRGADPLPKRMPQKSWCFWLDLPPEKYAIEKLVFLT